MEVLEGMTNTINRNDNLKIITEFWSMGIRNSGSSPTGFLNKLIECGFALYRIGQYLEPVNVDFLLRVLREGKLATLLCIKRKHFGRG